MSEPFLLDGKKLASELQKTIFERATAGKERCGRAPGLGVILVGDNPASKAYVGRKEKVAAKCGFATFDKKLPETASYADVSAAIKEFNDNTDVDGILLQLPLPGDLDSNSLLDEIDPALDADGLHPLNQGLLMRGEGVLRPCTPSGCMRLIDLAYSRDTFHLGEHPYTELPEVDLSGKNAVVIGRSILVGKAVAFMLLERNATVQMMHSRTKDIEKLCQQADVVVAAVGRPHMVTGDWIKEGAVVIDVGINRLENGKLTGDVDFESAAPKAAAITPVPGGVGPMTVAMLMNNTLSAFEKRFSE
jgi:methylenetetrahydrofolate dehydrogenase (NADP+)/methenyltetrahydrofolate cyclohydrolase